MATSASEFELTQVNFLEALSSSCQEDLYALAATTYFFRYTNNSADKNRVDLNFASVQLSENITNATTIIRSAKGLGDKPAGQQQQTTRKHSEHGALSKSLNEAIKTWNIFSDNRTPVSEYVTLEEIRDRKGLPQKLSAIKINLLTEREPCDYSKNKNFSDDGCRDFLQKLRGMGIRINIFYILKTNLTDKAFTNVDAELKSILEKINIDAVYQLLLQKEDIKNSIFELKTNNNNPSKKHIEVQELTLISLIDDEKTINEKLKKIFFSNKRKNNDRNDDDDDDNNDDNRGEKHNKERKTMQGDDKNNVQKTNKEGGSDNKKDGGGDQNPLNQIKETSDSKVIETQIEQPGTRNLATEFSLLAGKYTSLQQQPSVKNKEGSKNIQQNTFIIQQSHVNPIQKQNPSLPENQKNTLIEKLEGLLLGKTECFIELKIVSESNWLIKEGDTAIGEIRMNTEQNHSKIEFFHSDKWHTLTEDDKYLPLLKQASPHHKLSNK